MKCKLSVHGLNQGLKDDENGRVTGILYLWGGREKAFVHLCILLSETTHWLKIQGSPMLSVGSWKVTHHSIPPKTRNLQGDNLGLHIQSAQCQCINNTETDRVNVPNQSCHPVYQCTSRAGWTLYKIKIQGNNCGLGLHFVDLVCTPYVAELHGNYGHILRIA